MARALPRLLILVAASAVAGCIATPTATEDVAPSSARAAAAAGTLLDWRTANLTGDTAVRFALEFPKAATCEYDTGSTGSGQTGLRSLHMVEGPSGLLGFGVSGGGSSVRAHALVFDSRDLEGEGGRGAGSGGGEIGVPAGRLNLTLAGIGLEAWENGITGSDTIYLQLECDQAFTLVELLASDEVALFDTSSAEGVAAAEASPDVGVAVAAGAGGQYDSPLVTTYFGWTARSAAILDVDSPDASHRWTITPGAAGHNTLVGGPGEWRATVTGAHQSIFGFWGGILGLAPVESLPDFAGVTTPG